MILKKLFRKRSKRRLLIEVLVAFIVIASISLFVYFKFAYGAVVTWDGGGTTGTCGAGNENNWSCGENWSGNVAPGSGDVATFDGTSTKPAWIDSAINVAGIDINTGYTDTIEASASATIGSSGFAQSAGTWNGNSSTMDINNGSFTVDGGTHNATTGTWTVERNFTSSGGTLTMTGATAVFDGSSFDSSDDSTLSCTGSLGGTVNIAKVYSLQAFTLGNGCSISLGTSTSTEGPVTNNGTITNNNTATFKNNLDSTNGTLTNNSTINISGDASDSGDDTTLSCTGTIGGTVNITKAYSLQTFTLSSGCTITFQAAISTYGSIVNNGTINHNSGSPTLDINDGSLTNNTGATYNYTGTAITIERDFTPSGTFDLTGITVTLDGSSFDSSDDSTLSCTGSFGGTINITKVYVLQTFTLGNGCSISPASVSLKGPFINNGTFTVGNGLTFTFYNNIDSTNGTLTNNGTISIVGDGFDSSDDTTLSCNNTIGGQITVAKVYSLQTFTIGSNCTVNNFTRTSGNVSNPASPYTLTVQGNFSMSTTDTFGGANLTLNFGGTNNQTITQNAGTMSSPVTINKTSGEVALLTNFTIDSTGSTLTITDGTFTNSASNLSVSGNLTVSDTFTQFNGSNTFGTLTIGVSGQYTSTSSGDLIVGAGGVANSGTISLGTYASCPAADSISITSSSPASQRSWTGSGTFSIYDVSVTDQGGTATINALSSTGVSGNGSNWNFYPDECDLPINPRVKGGSRLRGGTNLH